MAFCNQCGAELAEGSEFCHHCGAKAYAPETPEHADVAPAESFTAQAQPLVSTVSPTKVMVLGIVGLALSAEPVVGIAGIVLSAMAKNAANTFEEEHGMIFGQAKVGRILGKIGFIVGIVMTIVWALYFCFFFALIAGIITDSMQTVF